MKFVTDLFTENNGKWFCPMRVAGLLATGVFLFLEIWDVCLKGHNFEAIPFGTAFAAIFGAVGAVITAKGRWVDGNPED